MKKQKLKIDALKVESFVTEVSKETQETAQGGGYVYNSAICTFKSIVFVCNIADPLHTWYAECQ